MKRPDFGKLTEKEKRQLGKYISRVLNRQKQALEQTKTELEIERKDYVI